MSRNNCMNPNGDEVCRHGCAGNARCSYASDPTRSELDTSIHDLGNSSLVKLCSALNLALVYANRIKMEEDELLNFTYLERRTIFEKLAKSYGLCNGRETADAMRWFYLGWQAALALPAQDGEGRTFRGSSGPEQPDEYER